MTQLVADQDDLWSEEHGTAFHEAGHAVLLFLLGRAFKRVSILADESTLGRLHCIPAGDWFRPDSTRDARTDRRLQEDAMCSLAGFAAERRWTSGRPGRPTDWLARINEGAMPDFEWAVDLAFWACSSDDEAQAWLDTLTERVEALLADPGHWRLVEAVALELLDRKQLSWRQFKAIVADGRTH